MTKRLFSLLLVVLLTLSSVSCTAPAKDSAKLSVVATNFAMYDFCRAVCGEHAEVTMLLSPSSESHDFEATLTDIARIADADLFVYVGGESEDWVFDVFGSLGNDGDKIETVCAIDVAKTVAEETVEGMAVDEEEDEEMPDEHVWTSIENAELLLSVITDKMAVIDAEHADDYRSRADAYKTELDGILADMKETVASGVRKTILVADRFPFRYLADELGLDYYAAFAGCSSATEPPLSTVNYLIEKTKSEEIPVIFVIEFSDGKTANAVRAECDVRVLTLESAHNVTKADFDGGVTYADLMRRNADALKQALN